MSSIHRRLNAVKEDFGENLKFKDIEFWFLLIHIFCIIQVISLFQKEENTLALKIIGVIGKH